MEPFTKAWRKACLVLIALLLPIYQVVAAERLALVIGNADYKEDPLVNPINDAVAISQKLKDLGFDVTQILNLRRDDMGTTIERFVQRIATGDTVVFFYAGHGVQVDGRNYLLATDAQLRSSFDISYNSINVGQFLERLDRSPAEVKIIFLDACRNNPFVRRFRGGSARGLARISNPPRGTLISFATRPGGVADDGTSQNGLYTEQLLKHIDVPGLLVEQMLKRVTIGTIKQSNGKQEPWLEGNLMGDFVFRSSLGSTAKPAASEPVEEVSGLDQFEREAWSTTKKIDSMQGYQAFVAEFPKSPYARIARIRLATLGLPPQVSNREAPELTKKGRQDIKIDNVATNLNSSLQASEPAIGVTVRMLGKDDTGNMGIEILREKDKAIIENFWFHGSLFAKQGGSATDAMIIDGPLQFNCPELKLISPSSQDLAQTTCYQNGLTINFSGTLERLRISIIGNAYQYDEFVVRLHRSSVGDFPNRTMRPKG